jgi:hypothetical protein
MAGMQGVPEDHQILTLYLPLDGSNNKYLNAVGGQIAAAGSPGMPTKFMVAKDAASQAVVNELTAGAAPAAVSFGGAGFPGMPGQPQAAPAAAPDSTDALERLAQLHASGALTDEEFAAQKAKIIGG